MSDADADILAETITSSYERSFKSGPKARFRPAAIAPAILPVLSKLNYMADSEEMKQYSS